MRRAPRKLYDQQPQRQWCHLDTCHYRAILHAEPPRSRLAPMIEKARMLKRRFANIITYLKHRITNATSESINAKVQWVKCTARINAPHLPQAGDS